MVERLPPSGAGRWSFCPISPTLEAMFPEDDGPEAREGNAAHFYVMEALYGRFWPVNHVTPNGYPIDADMITYGAKYIDDVREVFATLNIQQGEDFSYCVESPVAARAFIHPLLAGTPDTYLLLLSRKTLILWDYKYGHGFVDPYRNKQCGSYVASILEGAGVPFDDIVNWKFEIRIVQPRNYHVEANGPVRTWTPNGTVMRTEIERLRTAAYKTQEPNASAVTGPHCTHCKARLGCAAFLQTVGNAMDLAGAGLVREMSPGMLGSYLKMLATASERIKAARDALDAQAIAYIRAGDTVPYFKMGFVNSHRKWRQPDADVIATGKLLGHDLASGKALTPAEAGKKGIDATVIEALSFKPSGAAKLIETDETAAAKAFGA